MSGPIDPRQVTLDYLALVIAKATLAIETMQREGPTNRLTTVTCEVSRCARQAGLYAERAFSNACTAASPPPEGR